MKRKLIIAALAAIMTIRVVGCACGGNSTDEEKSSSAADAANADVPDEETQPDPFAQDDQPEGTDADGNNAQQTQDDEPQTTEDETDPTEDETADPTEEETSPEEETETPSSDASGYIEEASDEELIANAQELFEKACRTDWDFHVGCPYNLNYDSGVVNDLGWTFYLITDSGINGIADVEADYYEVFSERYGNDLGEIFLEEEGRVFALDGARGADIYYTGSKVVAVEERGEDEIFFTVENYYCGDDYDPSASYTENASFSAVIGEDGKWYAGEFTLPY